MENDEIRKYFRDCREHFKGMSDEQLIIAFNREVGNSGWTCTRALYLSAIHEEFETRQYDYSIIGNKEGLSFLKKIKLIGKKIVIDTAQ